MAKRTRPTPRRRSASTERHATVVLSGGAPYSPLMAGALHAIYAAGKTFTNFYTSGAGATVGKMLGMERAMKGGIGTAAITTCGGAMLSARYSASTGFTAEFGASTLPGAGSWSITRPGGRSDGMAFVVAALRLSCSRRATAASRDIPRRSGSTSFSSAVRCSSGIPGGNISGDCAAL